MKVIFLKFGLVIVISIVVLFQVKGQEDAALEIEQYKDKIPTKTYESLLTKEIEASQETDQLKSAQILKRIAKTSIELDENLSIRLFEKAMIAAQAVSHDSMIARIWMEGSIPFINKGLHDIADERLSKASDYWKNSADSLDLAECYILQGFLERMRGEHYLALDNLHKARAIQSEYLKPYEMWDVTNRIMINYSSMGDYQSAVDIAEEYITQTGEEERTRGYYTIVMNSSSYHMYLENYTKAKEYIDIILPKLKETKYPKFLASIYSRLSRMSLVKGDYVLANNYADTSIFYAEKFNTPDKKMSAYLKKYEALKKLEHKENQLHYLKKGYAAALATNRKSNVLWAAGLFSDFESSRSNFESAYYYLSVADSLRKEVFSDDLASKMDDLEKKLLLENSQEEIDRLNEQNELKEENLEKASRIRKYLIGFLVLAIGSIVLIYLLLRQRSRYNTTLEEKNNVITKALSEKELLLKEIHHRVKNNLQFISSLLRLQSDHVTDPLALNALQQGHNRVRSMALIHQNLYKENNLTGVSTKEYFTKLVTGLFSSNNIHPDRIILDLNVNELNLDVDTIVPIGLITNELVTNSLKYAFPDNRKGTVSISLQEKDKQLLLRVKDDGIGMSNEQYENLGSSFGYKLIRGLVGQMDGKWNINYIDGVDVKITIVKYDIL